MKSKVGDFFIVTRREESLGTRLGKFIPQHLTVELTMCLQLDISEIVTSTGMLWDSYVRKMVMSTFIIVFRKNAHIQKSIPPPFWLSFL